MIALAKLFKKPLNFMKNFKVSSIKVGSLFRLMERMKLDESRQKLADIIVILKVRGRKRGSVDGLI